MGPAVACLQRGCRLHCPWVFDIRDTFPNPPDQLYPGAGLVGEVDGTCFSVLPHSALESNSASVGGRAEAPG